MKKKLPIALFMLALLTTSALFISWRKGTPPSSRVSVKSFYSLSNTSSEQQLSNFIITNQLERNDIIAVSNSAAYVPGQGIYHTFLITYSQK